MKVAGWMPEPDMTWPAVAGQVERFCSRAGVAPRGELIGHRVTEVAAGLLGAGRPVEEVYGVPALGLWELQT